MGRRTAGFGIAAAMLAGCAAGAPSAPSASRLPDRPFNELFISLDQRSVFDIQSQENGTNDEATRIIVRGESAARARAYHEVGGCFSEEVPELALSVVTLPPGRMIDGTMQRIRGFAGISMVEPDYRADANFIPDDPQYPSQWAYPRIEAPAAWDVSPSTGSIVIGILDSGVDSKHEDLKDKLVSRINFTNSRNLDDKYGHGTHVAGIAGAVTNNLKGVAGTAPAASLMSIKVIGDNGSGQYSWVIKGIVYAADHGAKVINMSLGGYSFSQSLQDAVDYATAKGAVVVAAAGNDNVTTKLWPAACPNAIAVAATTTSDTKASFSNYGDWVDVAAPGASILSTLPTSNNRMGTRNYGTLSGTSMATPFVAGEAALLAAVPSGNSIRSRIESTGDAIAGTGSQFTFGRINLLRAVTAP